ncbi:MAG: Flp pilus assembly complex ATPase component TadA [Armatimonadota bacterium]|nr:Flp pilus assembly complex ATPase component TadA [Armatimonadota bacterium]
MVMQKKSLGDILVEKAVITQEQYQQAKDVQKTAPGDIGAIIVDLEFATEKEVAEARAAELGLKFVDLSRVAIEADAVKLVPEHIAKKYNLIPIKRDSTSQPNKLMVAIGDVKAGAAGIDDVKLVSRCQVHPVLGTRSDIEDAISRAYSGGSLKPPTAGRPQTGPINRNGNRNGNGISDLPAIIKDEMTSGLPAIPATPTTSSDLANIIGNEITEMGGADVQDDDDGDEKWAEEAPIIRIAHAIVQQAIREKASDIHIEPGMRSVRIRYRIDGVLNETMTVPKHIQNPLISRFKIMADLNIAERRVPQDGRIPIRHEGKDFDLRVSSLPTKHGEKMVMRILDKSSTQIGLSKLGFSDEVQNKLEELASQPNGMLLTTGPTGSGKTTTLYSLLNRINSVEKNIITAEDPVEYDLAGVSQVQMNKKAGLTFAVALRSFLRQDPDIIMVGEMRDLETAQIAVEASLTGHLVLSTLHTNDAPSAVMRLADMGVESYLIAATVIGIIAQRLCRKICSNCKEAYQVPAGDLVRFGLEGDPTEMITLYRGAGCEECRYKGYKGRVGLYELMTMNEEISELVVRRAPVADIREAAKANGMKELREDGLHKVLEGLTTPDEVMRVVFTAGF